MFVFDSREFLTTTVKHFKKYLKKKQAHIYTETDKGTHRKMGTDTNAHTLTKTRIN